MVKLVPYQVVAVRPEPPGFCRPRTSVVLEAHRYVEAPTKLTLA